MKTELMAKPTPNPKVENTVLAGILQIIGGSFIFILFGIGALVSKILSIFAGSSGMLPLVLFLISTAGCVLFLGKGIGNLSIANGFRKISNLMGKDTDIQLSVLEKKLGWDQARVLNTLRRQISRGFWKDAYIDTSNGIFMLGYSPNYLPANSGNREEDELFKTANGFIHEMTAISISISDPALKAKIEQLIDVARQIYAFVKKSPEKLRQIRQFSNYYLPMTVKLLRNYLELQSEAIKGENILEAMQKIKDSMTNIETTFRNQLNDLFEDKALDISVDIEVLQAMTNEKASGR